MPLVVGDEGQHGGVLSVGLHVWMGIYPLSHPPSGQYLYRLITTIYHTSC